MFRLFLLPHHSASMCFYFFLSLTNCTIFIGGTITTTIDSGGHVSDLVLARNCCLTRMLPGEAELVSE